MGVALATRFDDLSGPFNLTEIPIAVTGSWVKEGHRFSITEEDLDDIIKNFENRGNGEVVVDYEHASENPQVARGGPIPAAAWITKLSKKDGEDGKSKMLWGDVDFTDEAKKHIERKQYKYFSPAIDWGAVEKKTGRSKGATLTSGALTNHPFLEELPAIQLSDKGKVLDKIVVPVVDGAKIKVKIDAKHGKDDDEKKKLADISLDQKRAAISDAIHGQFDSQLDSPCCVSKGMWVKDVFDDYVIVESSDGKLYKLEYTMEPAGEIELGKPVEVEIDYVEATELHLTSKEFSDLHGAVLADDSADVKEGVHKSDYAFVGDPEKKGTWKYKLDTPGRVRNALARWGQHKGIPKDKEPGVLRKIMQRAKQHGITVDKTNPKYKAAASALAAFDLRLGEDGFLSEVATMKMTDKQFRERIIKLTDAITEADKHDEHSELMRDVAGDESKSLADRKFLTAIAHVLDDMDAYGVEGDTGEQDELRSEAETRAKKIDTRAPDAEHDELSDKKGKKTPGGGDDDELEATEAGKKLQKFTIRRMRAGDKVGHMGHHAVIAGGKLAGFIAHKDLMDHAKACGAEIGHSPGTMSEQELTEVTETFLQEQIGRPLTLSETVKFVETGINAGNDQSRTKARKLLMTEAVGTDGKFDHRKVRRLFADGKIDRVDYADFEDACEDVEKFIHEGRFLPNQRGALIGLCLSDKDNFLKFAQNQPRSMRTQGIGLRSAEEEGQTASAEVIRLTEEKMKKNDKIKYGQAMALVLSENPELKNRYDKEQRKLM
jgi:Mu-like prophage I protein